MKLRLLFILTLLALNPHSFGQQTMVSGTVVDSVTQKPIPFALIKFRNSTVGTRTDTLGYFEIVSRKATDSLEVSFTGYQTQIFVIPIGEETEFTVHLNEKNKNLQTVIITPGENPAFEILRRVKKNKKFNNPEKLEAWECEVYNRIRIDANNMGDSTFDSRIFKNMEFVGDYMDTTGKNSLPSILSQSISDYYFKKDPVQEKEVIKALDVRGFNSIELGKFSGAMYQNVNIYKNHIDLFTKDFISPIADQGRTYYRYYLQDNDTLDGVPCYHLRFVPRRKGDAVFDGDIWITDSTYAVKKVICKIGDDVNVNYVTALEVEQSYSEVAPGVWMVTEERMRGDFDAFSEWKKNRFIGGTVHKNTTRRNFKINEPYDFDFYVTDIEILDSAEKRDEAYWVEHRHVELNDKEAGVLEMIDSLKKNKRFRFYENALYLGYTGHWRAGPVEVGNIGSLYNFNQVEGHRFMLSLRSSNAFSRKVEISTFGIYGLNDKEFKYGASLRWKMKSDPRTMFRVNYKKRIEQLGIRASVGDVGSSFSTLFSLGPLDKLTMVNSSSVSLERDWRIDMRTFNKVEWRKFIPLGNSDYSRIDPVTGDTSQIASLTSFEVRNQIMYTREEKFVNGQFDRMSLGSRYPIISLTHTWAFKGVLGSEYDFHRLDFVWTHRPKIGGLGKLEYTIYAGKIFGTVPYPFLNVHQGNQTLYIQRSTMNLLNYYEFISDEWVGINFEHRLMGLILDRVPLIRRLKLRSVWSAKMVVGRYNPKHNAELLLPSYSNELRHPYYELSVGLENIVKFIRVDAIWRLNYLDHVDVNDNPVPRFGVKFVFTSDF